ncbi:hypothetical protein NDU88_001983 [Pleurodeles waltl]|uniref:Uncharacterized protein n=1 Tax=Pleurodeles waltl TaxID=8319 RepID=A0AAV7U9Z6_PLEWA|nr:hypothetical protein NDU88_001983 [Pleurodeles waltl]
MLAAVGMAWKAIRSRSRIGQRCVCCGSIRAAEQAHVRFYFPVLTFTVVPRPAWAGARFLAPLVSSRAQPGLTALIAPQRQRWISTPRTTRAPAAGRISPPRALLLLLQGAFDGTKTYERLRGGPGQRGDRRSPRESLEPPFPGLFFRPGAELQIMLQLQSPF